MKEELKYKITLESGEEFHGLAFGYPRVTVGELVFNTGMSGYQEILSDPSYKGQMIVMTFPLIGNYGINRVDYESQMIHSRAFIVKELNDQTHHFQSFMNVDEYLYKNKVVGIRGIDTRALTKIIRQHGTVKAAITPIETNKAEITTLLQNCELKNLAHETTTKQIQKHFQSGQFKNIVLVDFGYKKNILTELLKRNFNVFVVPFTTSFEEIQKLKPDGILLSNGPGDPIDCMEVVPTILKLQATYPLFGICLGHQILALANGAQTYKLKFGHHGINQPVKNLENNQTYITSQNHNYAVLDSSIDKNKIKVTFINLNDSSIEGMKILGTRASSVQFHPESRPGPTDTAILFDQFSQEVNNA